MVIIIQDFKKLKEKLFCTFLWNYHWYLASFLSKRNHSYCFLALMFLSQKTYIWSKRERCEVENLSYAYWENDFLKFAPISHDKKKCKKKKKEIFFLRRGYDNVHFLFWDRKWHIFCIFFIFCLKNWTLGIV